MAAAYYLLTWNSNNNLIFRTNWHCFPSVSPDYVDSPRNSAECLLGPRVSIEHRAQHIAFAIILQIAQYSPSSLRWPLGHQLAAGMYLSTAGVYLLGKQNRILGTQIGVSWFIFIEKHSCACGCNKFIPERQTATKSESSLSVSISMLATAAAAAAAVRGRRSLHYCYIAVDGCLRMAKVSRFDSADVRV